MEYITPHQAAEKWNLSLRRVQYYCANQKIPGAVRAGRQWFIPADATKPVDGRTKCARQSAGAGDYRFPVFVFSRFFTSHSELSDEENQLRDAQMLTIKGEYLQSVQICRNLARKSTTVSVIFGAFATNAYNFILLGQYTEVLMCMMAMEVFAEKDLEHEEDYRLIIAALKFQYSYDASNLPKICVGKLSGDSLILHYIFLFQTGIFDPEPLSEIALKAIETLCRHLELRGILPALLLMRGTLGFYQSRARHEEERRFNIAEACQIGFENKYYSLLAKVSSLDPEAYRAALDEYGAHFSNRIARMHQQNLDGWTLVIKAARGEQLALGSEFTDEQSELLLLMACELTNQEIADMKGISKDQANARIRELRKLCNCSTKEELVRYARGIIIR